MRNTLIKAFAVAVSSTAMITIAAAQQQPEPTSPSEPPKVEEPMTGDTAPEAAPTEEPMEQGDPAGQATEEMPQQDATADAGESPSAEELLAKADEDMRMVLDKLKELGAKPIEQLSVEEARTQPTPADAVQAIMSETTASTSQPQVTTEDIMIPGAEGEILARVYTPSDNTDEAMPVILYFHGGGWVIAGIDVYDASPRALAEQTGAVVISSTYRQAPEHPFPAAHEDAVAAYEWVVENAGQYNGDSTRIAVVGESAGGNLAANVAIAARENEWQEPVHQVLIYPVAGTSMDTPSYKENANAMPLSKAGMQWFFEKVAQDPEAKQDPRLDLVGREDLEGLPPTTVVTAEIDPLRSEGEEYADMLQASGVDTEMQNFDGSTHEFFGMAAVVQDAKDAQAFVAERLMASFQEEGSETEEPQQ